ncbi:MAG: hypothetical protein K0A89_01430 [ANME-2 cluster archaeon]|nr:hypothetical protein [ANME-2 cluster archaeon]
MKFKTVCILTVMVILLSPNATLADIGPKPSMEFNLVYEISGPVTLIDGQQLECEDDRYLQSHPIEQPGPQGFYCVQDSCSSMAYSYAPYQKLVLNFSDRTRESNVFKARSFNARFDVRVTDTGLVVKERTVPALERMLFFLVALVLTLTIEVLAALIFLLAVKRPKSVLKSVVKANLISLPVVWFIFPVMKVFFLVVVLSEIFAVVFEGYFIHSMDKTILSLKQSLILSMIMNAASFVLGGFIIFVFGMWYS